MDASTTTVNSQKSLEWIAERLGKFTASEISKLMAGIETKTVQTYILEKVAEVLTGESAEPAGGLAIMWGVTNEPLARDWFKKLTTHRVEECGFIPFGEDAGGSPDGLVNDDAILEIKCPFNATNHVKHLLIDSPEYFKKNFPEYYYQMQSNMLFSKRTKGFFVSFDPRMDNEHGFFIFEMKADLKEFELIKEKIALAVTHKNNYLKMLADKLEIAA